MNNHSSSPGHAGGTSNIVIFNPDIIMNATSTPVSASPAMSPAVNSSPVRIIFSLGLISVCLIASSHSLISSSSVPYVFVIFLSVIALITPPKNIGVASVNGRYIPIATGSTGISISMSTSASTIPASTNGHVISPPSTPCMTPAISPACGAGRLMLPIVYALCSADTTNASTGAAAIIPISSANCCFQGVAPIICPAVMLCSTSPDIAAQHAMTVAISSATPKLVVPENPNASSISDVISSIDTVTPDVGLFDEPTSPAM